MLVRSVAFSMPAVDTATVYRQQFLSARPHPVGAETVLRNTHSASSRKHQRSSSPVKVLYIFSDGENMVHANGARLGTCRLH